MSTSLRRTFHVVTQPNRICERVHIIVTALFGHRRCYFLTACRPFSSSSLNEIPLQDRRLHNTDGVDNVYQMPQHRYFDSSIISANPPAFVGSVAPAISPEANLASLTPEAEKNCVFEDSSVAHGAKSITEILRAIAVFHMCQMKPLVRNADYLLACSKKVLGGAVTNAFMKASFFNHFCAGEDVHSIHPAIHKLKDNGVSAILNYSAESDNQDPTDLVKDKKSHQAIITSPPYNDQLTLVYDYRSEEQCDRHVDLFMSCIHAVRDVAPTGFAAIKVTALGNPQLLERMSIAANELKKLFAQLDLDKDGVLSRQEFTQGYSLIFCDANQKLPELLEMLDAEKTNAVDYITWTNLVTLRDMPRIKENCSTLALAVLSKKEIDLIETMKRRLFKLAEESLRCNTRLLIDAEQTRFQPAIDNLVLELQQKYNAIETTKRPTIFNTYQCYLKNTPMRIVTDVEHSKRFRYHFAAKLVRGAYMVGERAEAKELGVPSPIHDKVEDTHKCYNEAVEYLLRFKVATNASLEVVCATHNQDSILRCMNLMNELGIEAKADTVQFAQLYGMSDSLTYTLGKNGYNAFKCVPYGEVEEVMPYLVRRAQENGGMLDNTSKEMRLLYRELKKRLIQ